MPTEVDFGPELGVVSFPDEMTDQELRVAADDARRRLIVLRQQELAAETLADLTWQESLGAAARAIPRTAGQMIGKAIQSVARAAADAPVGAFRGPGEWRSPDEIRMQLAEEARRRTLTPQQRLAEIEAGPVFTAGRQVEQATTEALPPVPGEEEAIMPQLGAGIGSVVPMVFAGPAGPALYGLSASEDFRRDAAQEIDRRTVEALQAGDEATAEALQATKPDVMNQAGLAGGTIGAATERVLGVAGKVTRGVPFVGPRLARIAEGAVPKFAGRLAERAVRGALTGAPTEAVQEAVEQGLGNAAARMIYDPNRSIGEGLVESALLGAGVGGIVGGVAGRGRPAPLLPAAEQAVAETGTGPTPPPAAPEPAPEVPEPELAPDEDVGELGEQDVEELIREASGGAAPGEVVQEAVAEPAAAEVVPEAVATDVPAPRRAEINEPEAGLEEQVGAEAFTPIDRAVMDSRAQERPVAGELDAEAALTEAVPAEGETPVDVAVREGMRGEPVVEAAEQVTEAAVETTPTPESVAEAAPEVAPEQDEVRIRSDIKQLKAELAQLRKQYGPSLNAAPQADQLGGLAPTKLRARGLQLRISELQSRLPKSKNPTVTVTPKSKGISTVKPRGQGLLLDVLVNGRRVGEIGRDNFGKLYAVANGEVVGTDFSTVSQARDALVKASATPTPESVAEAPPTTPRLAKPKRVPRLKKEAPAQPRPAMPDPKAVKAELLAKLQDAKDGKLEPAWPNGPLIIEVPGATTLKLKNDPEAIDEVIARVGKLKVDSAKAGPKTPTARKAALAGKQQAIGEALLRVSDTPSESDVSDAVELYREFKAGDRREKSGAIQAAVDAAFVQRVGGVPWSATYDQTLAFLRARARQLAELVGGQAKADADAFFASEDPIEAAKYELRAAWQAQQKLGIRPNAEDQIRLYRALVNLAQAYIRRGVQNVEDFAKRAGVTLNNAVRRAFDDALNSRETPLANLPEEITEELATMQDPLAGDDLGMRPAGTETKRGAEMDVTAGRPGLTPEVEADAQRFAQEVLEEAGISYTRVPGSRLFQPTSDFDQEFEGRRLLQIARERIAQARNEGRYERAAALINTLREYFAESDAFSPKLRAELYLLGQMPASELGRGLGALAVDANELGRASRNPYGTMSRFLYQNFGGEEVMKFLETVMKRYRGLFTDKEIADIAAGSAPIRDLLSRLGLMSTKDDGGRVYRAVQSRLKTKPAKTPAEKERKAREDEAIEAIIEGAKAVGVVEPEAKPGQKLTPDERLGLMTRPETQAKIQQAVDGAVADAEFNAGYAVLEAQAARSQDPADAERVAEARAVGERPPDDAIEQGLRLPEYAHWLAIRDSMLAYSPTTDRLVQDVIRGRFKGTRFQPAPKAKPEDLRINLNALAAQPDAEVDRVIAAQVAALDEVMDINGADAATRTRVHAAVVRNIASQIQKARKVIVERFLDSQATRTAPRTASEQLQRLLNAGVTADPRYQQQATRNLLAKVAAQYVKAPDFSRIATATREAKQAFLDRVYNEVVTGENLTDPWMQAAVWTRLTEQLMAAETVVAERLAGARDVSYEPREIPTEEQQAERRAAAVDKLAGGVRAGLLDQRMVRDVASKPVVQRLLPNMTDMVRSVMETSAKGQRELAQRFAREIGGQMNIDPANADKAGALLAQAYGQKMDAARRKAVEAARKQFEKKPEEEGGLGKPSWRRVIEAANAGLLDASDVLADLAAEQGFRMPTEAEAATLKDLAERIQDLEVVTEAEAEQGLTSAEKAALNSSRRAELVRQLQTRWARIAKPIQGNKQNRAEAINEMTAANLLATIGFVTRQTIDITTQVLVEPMASAFESAVAQREVTDGAGGPLQFAKDLSSAFADAIEVRLKSARMALAESRRALKGRAAREMTNSVQTGIMALERANLYAQELDAQGKHARATAYRFLSLLRWSYRVAAAMDYLQGSLAESQMLRQFAETELRANGVPASEARRQSKAIVGDMAAEYALARQIAENQTDIQQQYKDEAAWEYVRMRQYQRMESAGIDSVAPRYNAKFYREMLGWNLPELGGPGAIVGKSLGAFRQWLLNVGLPSPTSNFANAMAIATNRAMTFVGMGMFPSFFKGSPWYATQQQRTMRKFEAALGLGMTAAAAAMWKAGLIKVFTRWPDDKEERDLWERAGHRPYTVEINLGDDRALKLSMSVGPMAIIRPGLVGMGEIDRALAKLERRNERNRRAAERQGKRFVPETLTAEEMFQIFAVSAYGALLGGGRTTGGMISSAQFQGQFDPKRMFAGAVQAMVPFAPMSRQITTLMGRTIDPKASNFLEVAVPTPWSGEQKLNFFGDPVGTHSDLDRILSSLTGGTSITGGADPERAYRLLARTGWQPKGTSLQRHWDFGGTRRPMTPEEYKRFNILWGRDLKRRISAMPWTPDITDRMDEAEDAAKAAAARKVGVR